MIRINYFLYFSLLAIGIFFFGCENDRKYDFDKGYEAAWNEENEPTRFSSQEYIDGYEQGLDDAAMYDEGYYDGYNKKVARYPKDFDYMDGYKDGCKRR